MSDTPAAAPTDPVSQSSQSGTGLPHQVPPVQDPASIQQLLHALSVAAGVYAPTLPMHGLQQPLYNPHQTSTAHMPFVSQHDAPWGRLPHYPNPYAAQLAAAQYQYGYTLPNPTPQGGSFASHATPPSTVSEKTTSQPVNTAEEKRRRNTEASARFRVKKKLRTYNLQKTVDDLAGRAEELEKEAADLRRENGWLKEIVMLKGTKSEGTAVSSSRPSESASRKKEKQKQQQDNGSDSDSDTEVESTSKRRRRKNQSSSR